MGWNPPDENWEEQFPPYENPNPPPPPPPPPPPGPVYGCRVTGSAYTRRSYSSSVTYRIRYKTQTAPDVEGSSLNPTTGWVTLKTATRGQRANYDQISCTPDPVNPSTPLEDNWVEYIPLLGAAPNKYNMRVHFDTVNTREDPCSALPAEMCSGRDPAGSRCPGGLLSSTLVDDHAEMTLEFVQGLT